MDKIKEKLGPNIKYVFWAAWGILMIASAGIWWVATGSLVADADANTKAIDGAYSTLQQIRGTASTHPNEFSHGKMEERVDEAKNDVFEAWDTQWKYQEKIMVWPTELNRAGTNDFVDAFDDYLPIETTTEFPMPEAEEVDQTLRKRYLEYIERQLPGLAETAGTKWKAGFKSGSSGVSGFGSIGSSSFDFESDDSAVEKLVTRRRDEPLVVWSTGSQAALLDQVFPWRSKEAPSTLEILYSQEDLWVLKNLLEIISTVNGNAKKPFQAIIHEILEIQLGKKVAGRAGAVSRVVSADEGGGDSASGSDAGGISADGAEKETDPADKRYIDTANKPIPASTLRSAMDGKSPENAFMNVAKRLPVKLTLKMDQRKLPKLLSACGNARLMVEIRQVRINTSGSSAASFGSGGGAQSVGGFESGGFGGGFGFGAATSTAPVVSKSSASDYPYDLPIEVYGVIYIYNPPDLDKLGVEAVTTETIMTEKSVGAASDGTTDKPADDAEATPESDEKPTESPAEPASEEPVEAEAS